MENQPAPEIDKAAASDRPRLQGLKLNSSKRTTSNTVQIYIRLRESDAVNSCRKDLIGGVSYGRSTILIAAPRENEKYVPLACARAGDIVVIRSPRLCPSHLN